MQRQGGKKCENPVPNDDIVKGYEYEPDQYVVFENEDFDKVKIKSSKVIELEGFVEASEIHPMWYDTPYYVGPDGDIAGKTYGLLRETLASAEKLGIGRVVLRDREEIVILGTVDDGLVMCTSSAIRQRCETSPRCRKPGERRPNRSRWNWPTPSWIPCRPRSMTSI